jgi:hypothetical protein
MLSLNKRYARKCPTSILGKYTLSYNNSKRMKRRVGITQSIKYGGV